jgi:hypothetical protein
MANKGRTPIPKTQKQIANSFITPADPQMGNPNLANPNYEGVNRGTQVSWQDDGTKPFTVGLEDIDGAIMYYFQNVIQPYVIQNDQRIEVPIIYGSPERWKSVQKDGYYKDKNGAIMLPLLMFKRNDIVKNRSIANKLDANAPFNYQTFTKNYSKQDFYSNFNILNNRIPVKTYYAVVMPDYVTINYSCVVQTYYMDQMNRIVEAINYASDSYWGNPQRYQFKAMIDSISTPVELVTNNNRSVKATFDIKVNGYIIPEVMQKYQANVSKKFYSAGKIIFALETTSNDGIFLGKELDGRIVTPNLNNEDVQNRSTIIP